MSSKHFQGSSLDGNVRRELNAQADAELIEFKKSKKYMPSKFDVEHYVFKLTESDIFQELAELKGNKRRYTRLVALCQKTIETVFNTIGIDAALKRELDIITSELEKRTQQYKHALEEINALNAKLDAQEEETIWEKIRKSLNIK